MYRTVHNDIVHRNRQKMRNVFNLYNCDHDYDGDYDVM